MVEPDQEPETRSVLVKGQHVEYQLLSPDALDILFQRLTPLQRRALTHVAKGLSPSEVAKATPSTVGTLTRWREAIPGYKDAWYNLQAQSVQLGVEAVKSAAKGDALAHYETINGISMDADLAPRDRANAAKEALTLAGAYKGTSDVPMSIGDILVQVAMMDQPAGGLPGPTETVALAPGEQQEPAIDAGTEAQ